MHRQSETSGWTNRKWSNILAHEEAANVRESQSKAIWVDCRTSDFSLDRALLRILVYLQYKFLKAFDGVRQRSHASVPERKPIEERTNGK